MTMYKAEVKGYAGDTKHFDKCGADNKQNAIAYADGLKAKYPHLQITVTEISYCGHEVIKSL